MCNLYANIATTEAMRRIFQIESEQDHLGNAPSRPGIHPELPGADRAAGGECWARAGGNELGIFDPKFFQT